MRLDGVHYLADHRLVRLVEYVGVLDFLNVDQNRTSLFDIFQLIRREEKVDAAVLGVGLPIEYRDSFTGHFGQRSSEHPRHSWVNLVAHYKLSSFPDRYGLGRGISEVFQNGLPDEGPLWLEGYKFKPLYPHPSSLRCTEIIAGQSRYFACLRKLAAGANSLPSCEDGVGRNDKQHGKFGVSLYLVFGFLLIVGGFASECFFWTKYARDFSTNMEAAGYFALLLASVGVVWGGMWMFGHWCGLV